MQVLQLRDHGVVRDFVAHLDAHATQHGRVDHRVDVHLTAHLGGVDLDQSLDLLLLQRGGGGHGDHRLAHVAGELVDQPLDGLQVAAAAQVAGGVFGEPHGDLVQGLAGKHLAEQPHAGLAGGLVVVQLGADDRQVQQCGMQLGQLDGYLQRGVGGVRIVHHGVHAEVLHRVGDVAHTAPTAGDQVGHDLHGHRMRVATEQENSLKIIQRQQQVGTAAATDVSEAMSVYQQARASVASYQTQVMQDKNALNLLAGTTLAENLLPGTLESLPEQMISLVPAGVSSDVLLRRPDIQEAEHNLKSANADIGAARANFFPTISLTASAGVGSDALSSLFSHGMQIWSFAPSVTLPLFTGGSNLAQLRYAEAQKRGLIATYEKTVQSAFKDVANALARRTTLEEQLDAQRQYVKAEQQTVDVGLRRYQAGVGDYLTVLTAQRSLWSAQQELLALQLTDFTNRITLWQSLGGGMSSLK